MSSTFSSSLIKLSFLIACSGAVTSQAAPLISSASGSSEIVLTGSGFGEKAVPAPALFDSITNQSTYGTVAAGTTVPVGSPHPWTTNTFSYPGAVVFSKSYPRHNGAPYHYRTSNYRGYLQWPAALGRTSPPVSQQTIYLSFWYRPDADVGVSGHSSKFVRIWDAESGLGTRISWTQMHLTYDPAGPSWPAWGGNPTAWNRMELLVDSRNHRISAWTNGRLRHTITDYTKSPDYSTRGLSVARIGFDPGGTSPPSIDSSFGEIYVDTTPARIEVCSQPEWTMCTHKEVQVAKSWTNSRVVFNLARGSLPANSPLYAYVVDSDGLASTKGVVIGTGVVEPNPPSAVSVE